MGNCFLKRCCIKTLTNAIEMPFWQWDSTKPIETPLDLHNLCLHKIFPLRVHLVCLPMWIIQIWAFRVTVVQWRHKMKNPITLLAFSCPLQWHYGSSVNVWNTVKPLISQLQSAQELWQLAPLPHCRGDHPNSPAFLRPLHWLQNRAI